jgi:hypothetical protein
MPSMVNGESRRDQSEALSIRSNLLQAPVIVEISVLHSPPWYLPFRYWIKADAFNIGFLARSTGRQALITSVLA